MPHADRMVRTQPHQRERDCLPRLALMAGQKADRVGYS